MARISPGAGAALSVLLSSACGYITNLVTDEWRWSLGAALAVLVVAAAGLAWWDRSQPGGPPVQRTTVRQQATSGSTITGGRIDARGGARVTETARDQGTIKDSSIEATGAADVDREAADSRIENTHIKSD